MPADMPFTVAKACESGRVRIRTRLRAGGFGSSISVQGAADISTADARAFAADLIRQADEEDARVAKKQATEERRRKWREREIAAGRLRVMSVADVLGRR